MRFNHSIRSCRIWLLAIIVIALAAASAAANQARAGDRASPIFPVALDHFEGFQIVAEIPSGERTMRATEAGNTAGPLFEPPARPMDERTSRDS